METRPRSGASKLAPLANPYSNHPTEEITMTKKWITKAVFPLALLASAALPTQVSAHWQTSG